MTRAMPSRFLRAEPGIFVARPLSASILIIRNAGGFVTDLEGIDVDPINHQGYIVASANAACRDEFLEMITPLIQSMGSN